MKQIIAIILSVTLAVSFMPVFSFADAENENEQQKLGSGVELEQQDLENEHKELVDEEKATEDDSLVEESDSNESNNTVHANQIEANNDVSHDICDYTFTLSQTKYFYDGKSHMPDVICEELTEGVDYEVEYDTEYYWDDEYEEDIERNPTGAGTYYVYITGIGDYWGNTTFSYKIIATSISLNKTSATLYRKGVLKLKATIKNPNGKTTFSSSNKKVATVTTTGEITAKSKGTATITVKNGYAKKKVKITVKNPKLNKSKVTIYCNTSKTLKVTGKIGKATFKSSNKKVATVNKSGKITAKKKGKCTITVKSNGVTLKCTVTVKNPKLSKSKVTLHNSYKIKLKVIGGKGKIKWKTSNSKVATVSSKGVVKGKKAGKCTITAKRGKYKMTCKIKVPKSYKGYSTIPDFGAVYGKTAAFKDDNAFAYKVSKKYIKKYIKLLKKKGFAYYTSSDGMKVYMNVGWDMVGVGYIKGYVCIAYANAWDGSE